MVTACVSLPLIAGGELTNASLSTANLVSTQNAEFSFYIPKFRLQVQSALQ
jgi:hypothetical protein